MFSGEVTSNRTYILKDYSGSQGRGKDGSSKGRLLPKASRDAGGLDHGGISSDEKERMNVRYILEKYSGKRSGRIKDKKNTDVQEEAKTILTFPSILTFVDRQWCHLLRWKRLGEKGNHEFYLRRGQWEMPV